MDLPFPPSFVNIHIYVGFHGSFRCPTARDVDVTLSFEM